MAAASAVAAAAAVQVAAVSAVDRGQFTQNTVADFRRQFPDSSVIVVCQCQAHHLEGGNGVKTTQASLDNQKFDVYIIPPNAGQVTFVLEGDGGFQNWAFQGRIERPGSGKTLIIN